RLSHGARAANGTPMAPGGVGRSGAGADEPRATKAAAAAAVILVLGMAVLLVDQAPSRDEPRRGRSHSIGSIQLHAEFPKDRGGVVGRLLDQGAKFRRAR